MSEADPDADNQNTFLGIQDYTPHRFLAATEVEQTLGASLQWFVGRELESVWLMWDVEAGEWWCDGPVILGIGGRQLEVSVMKVDELYISIDAIDREVPLAWCGVSDPPLCWHRNPPIGRLPELLDSTVERVGVGEYAWELSEAMNMPKWLLVSLELELTGGAFLAVENGLDENAFRFESPSHLPHHRVRWFAAKSS